MQSQNEVTGITQNNSRTEERPGIIGRFVLRNTPVPILVREFLADHAGFEFTEDYNLPENFSGIDGLPEPQRTSFFLRDRSTIRLGVVRRSRELEPNPQEDLALSMAVRDELLRCDKNPADFVVLPFAPGDVQNREVFRGRGAATIIWLQERTTLENLIGGGPKADLPPKLIMRATELLPDTNVVDYAYGDAAQTIAPRVPQTTDKPRGLVVPVAAGEADSSTKEPLLHMPPTVPAPRSDSRTLLPTQAPVASEPVSEPAKEPPEWRDWTNFRYGVSGTTKGQLRRRMLIRHNDGFLRAIMLAAEKQPSAEYLARFFEAIGDAADPVRTHREWLRRENQTGEFGDISSISFALNSDGRFLSTGRGIRPVLWRADKKQLAVFPITQDAPALSNSGQVSSENGAGENPFRIVRGTLNPGDRLLLTPGRFASHELRELLAVLKLSGDDEVRERLDNYLDYRAHGKALLMVRST